MNGPHAPGSPLSFFGRLLWVVVGPLAITVATVLIATKGGGWLTAADVTFFVVLGLMFVGRILEFRGGNPLTAEGTPATATDLRNYLVFGAVIALAVWVVANVIGNHVLT